MTPTFPITSSNVEPVLDRPMILLQALLKRTTGTVALPSLPNVMGITQRRSAVVVIGIYRSPGQDDPSVSRNLEIAQSGSLLTWKDFYLFRKKTASFLV